MEEKIDPKRMTTGGSEIPKTPAKVDEALSFIMQVREDVLKERRFWEKKLSEQGERHQAEIQRVKREAQEAIHEVVEENRVLLRTLSRLTAECERYGSELQLAKARVQDLERPSGVAPLARAPQAGLRDGQAAGPFPVVQAVPAPLAPQAVPGRPETLSFKPAE